MNKSDRSLTGAERRLVAGMFGSAVDVDAVSVRRRRYWLLQPRWITMAPDGHIWCHPAGQSWSGCYASDGLGMQAHFIHEMTHVWQHQSGVNLLLRRLPFARYRYEIRPGRSFASYGIEQQACIVADAFVARARGAADARLEALLPFGPAIS